MNEAGNCKKSQLSLILAKMDLQLSDNEAQIKLSDILNDIEQGLLEDNCESILEEVSPIFDKLGIGDQQQFIKYIHEKFNDRTFVNHEKFQPIKIQKVDQQKYYRELRGAQDWKKLANAMEDDTFCLENQFPLFWSKGENVDFFLQFDFVLQLLLDFHDLNKPNNGSNYLQIIQYFLKFQDLAQGKCNQSKNQMEQIVGSMLERQLYQFIEYKKHLKQTNIQIYQRFIKQIQEVQLQIIDKKYLDFHNQGYKALIEILTFNYNLPNLEQYLKEKFQIQDEQLNYKELQGKVDGLLFQTVNLEEIYFIYSFYFLISYADQFGLLKDKKKLDNDLCTIKGDQQKLRKQMERFFKSHKQIKDEIYEFIIYQLMYTQENENTDKIEENLIKYHIATDQYEQMLQKYSEYNFQTIIQEAEILQTLVNYSQMLAQIKVIHIFKEDETIFKKLLLIKLVLEKNENLNTIQQVIVFNSNQSILEYSAYLEKHKVKFQNQESIVLILYLVGLVRSFPIKSLQLYGNIFKIENSFGKGLILTKLQEFIDLESQSCSSLILQELMKLQQQDWINLKKCLHNTGMQNLFQKFLNLYRIHDSEKDQLIQIFEILKQIGNILDFKQNDKNQILVQFLLDTPKNLFDLIAIRNFSIPEVDFLQCIQALIKFLKTFQPNELSLTLIQLASVNQNSIINFKFIEEQLAVKFSLNLIQISLKISYYQSIKNTQKLFSQCLLLYQEDHQFYENVFSQLKFFDNFKLKPTFLRNFVNQSNLPKDSNIGLEDFNLSITELSQADTEVIASGWMADTKSSQKFKFLIPLYFNVIKKKESFSKFVNLINIQKKENSDGFNMKLLFQIFYNNSNHELQAMLLKLWSLSNPIPLIYNSPDINSIKTENEIWHLNDKIFHIFPTCLPIINFSLSNTQQSYGKTSIINEVFYKTEVFETRDSSSYNENTIDIMFDFFFNESRKFAIADVHGQLPNEVLQKVLSLFKVWIIQMDTEEEIEQNYQKLDPILKTCKPDACCFIVRNAKFITQNKQDDVEMQLRDKNILLHKIKDLTQKGLDQLTYTMEIQKFSKFIYNVIEKPYNQAIKLQNLSNQDDFFKLIENFYGSSNQLVIETKQDYQIMKNLENELSEQVQNPFGFYSQDAFPMRNLFWSINNLKVQQCQFDGLTLQLQHCLVKAKQQEIDALEKKIPQVSPSKTIQLFQKIFESKNYYIVYIQMAERLKNFKEKHTFELQEFVENLNESLSKLQQEKKDQIYKSTEDTTQSEVEKKSNEKNETEIKILQEQLKEKMRLISYRNIGIELFWRELVQIKKQGMANLLFIDPIKILTQLVHKGEPFEFLDGDQLEINHIFLQEFFNEFTDPNKQKVFVMSVIGPQSSGKSTILNKMFGCHFWTSVGRCTKGIYLQLIKIHQKQIFNNLFDYIIILDTEGLQNPNQQDPQFDKRISLFVLTISDIIVLNVKGDINYQFRELVKMCVYTLSQMSSAISSIKLLSWCFNQNSDCKNHLPFLEQIQEISHSVNLQIKEKLNDDNQILDCNQLLDIKKSNIKVLGFATQLKVWRQNNNHGIFEEWQQLISCETFSEEAYLFGLRTIQQLTEKYLQQSEQQNIMTISQFLQNIESNWQSICRLPDLLEFAELCQHKQDKLMSQQWFKIIQNIQLNSHDLVSQLIQQEENQEECDLKSLKILEKDNRNLIQVQVFNINQQLEENLQTIQKDNKISKKIYQKYQKQLFERLLCFKMQCFLELVKFILEKKRVFQQNKGFQQLDDYIEKINSDQMVMQNLKENPSQIKANFNSIWQEILDNSMNQQDQAFQEYSQSQFKSIHSQFIKYQYNSQNEIEYKDLLQNQFNKTFPLSDQLQECDQIFETFKKELQQIQFKVLRNDINVMKYFDIFSSPMDKRMKTSTAKDIININDFYSYQAQLIQIRVEDFEAYIKSDFFFSDYQNYKENLANAKTERVSDFFFIIDFLGISFDQNFFQQLLEQKNNSQQAFKQLQDSFQWSNKKLLYNYIFNSAFYQSLKFCEKTIEAQTIEQLELELQKESKQHLIFVLNIEISMKQNNNMFPEFYCFFHHILNHKNSSKANKDFFSQEAVKIFEQIMVKQKIWEKLYFQIYQIIYSQMVQINMKDTDFKNQLQKNEITRIEINSADYNLIQIITSKIEQKIIEFNFETSKFGLILKDVGMRCIYYFSILIIWRFSCYKEWQTLEMNHSKLKEMREDQYQKYFAKMLGDLARHNQLIAQSYVKGLQELFFKYFYAINAQNAKKQITANNCTSFEFIAKLDNEILEGNCKQHTQINLILEYVSDQNKFIEQRVEQIIRKLQEQIKNQYQTTLNNQFEEYLSNILTNVIKLKDNSKNLVGDFASEEFFIENNFEQKKYSKIIFSLISKCIFGEQQSLQEFNLIKTHLQPIFTQNQYVRINPTFEKKYFIQQDQQINLVKPFIGELQTKLEECLENLKTKKVDLQLSELQIQQYLVMLRNNMNGCHHFCPMCKRKCDQSNHTLHKHQCQNGHQLRGMNGVLIGDSPSLKTCEEIDDDSEIQIVETGAFKKWKDVKAAYQDWLFKNFDTTQSKRVKEKMTKVWNNGVGKLVCNYLKIKMNNSNIKFEEKSQFNFIKHEPTHYIFVLDDSGSMTGSKWQKVMKGCAECMQHIKKNPLARVSVITFDDEATILFDCIEITSFEFDQKHIPFRGKGTNFGNAFSEIYNLLTKQTEHNFQKNIILFYTDGEGEFPSQEINQFSKLPVQLKKSIQFLFCTDQNIDQSSRSLSTLKKPALPQTIQQPQYNQLQLNQNPQPINPQRQNNLPQKQNDCPPQSQKYQPSVLEFKFQSFQQQMQPVQKIFYPPSVQQQNIPSFQHRGRLIENENDFSSKIQKQNDCLPSQMRSNNNPTQFAQLNMFQRQVKFMQINNDQSSPLMQINEKFRNMGDIFSDLKENINLEKLSEIWIEKISKNHHQYKNKDDQI